MMNSRKPVKQTGVCGPALCNWRATVAGAGHRPSDARPAHRYRFFDLHFWWMHAMVVVWAVFAAMLYGIEPLFLHRRMEQSGSPERDFARMERMHRILLSASLIAVAGAMAGAHGLI